MFYLLRPQDTIKVAVKLESAFPGQSTATFEQKQKRQIGIDDNEPESFVALYAKGVGSESWRHREEGAHQFLNAPG